MNTNRVLPGIAERDRLRLNVEVREALAAALRSGRRPASLIVHVESDTVCIETRAELTGRLRAGGCNGLARRVERLNVALGEIAIFVDTDGATHVTSIPIAGLLDAADLQRIPSVMRGA